MNNLEPTSVLELAVFGMAIAQVLMIILTIRRERDVNELRALVEEQRLHLAELRAWLAGRNASRIRSERKPHPEPAANLKASELGMPVEEPRQSRPSDDNVARETKALEWQREVAARLQSGIRELAPTEPATAPASENGFKWFRDDPDEPREIVEARGIVNGLGKTYQPRAQAEGSPESLAKRPGHDELDRINRAVTRLKEDMDKSSELPSLGPKPPADLK